MIRTVLKDINKEDFGKTMCHEHFIVDLTHIRKDDVSIIETVEEVVPEIRMMMDLGVEAAVEVTTIDLNRDVLKLKEISEKTGLKIVCSTGYYLAPYHPKWLNDATVEEIAEVYIKELTEGIEDTGIKAGIIAEIASSDDGFVGNERKILKAAGLAASRTGCAVSTHTGKETARETVEILLSYGMNPDKIILGHQDLIDDSLYHLELLKMGVNLAFDTCGKTAYQPDEIRAVNMLKIIKAGYGDHILVSNDVSRRTYFVSHGGDGYLTAYKKVLPLLKEMGATDEDIEKITVKNPARILSNAWK
ncbi:MAG: phosphotriesterase family protein [Erysipelotrichaceae bacterium]|jgi:phosphotriesterase-related protein